MAPARKGLFLGPALTLLTAFATPATAQAPGGFVAPPLNPTGTSLETRELAPGVYALLSTRPPVDNSGFVVGERGVLVIDAHINGTMARMIQEAVRRVTPKPILYLVNTNAFGDHWFGNYAFPSEVRIVAHRAAAERMKDFEALRRDLLPAVDNDPAVLADVRPRLPDEVYDDFLRLDLGGRLVELHHLGVGDGWETQSSTSRRREWPGPATSSWARERSRSSSEGTPPSTWRPCREWWPRFQSRRSFRDTRARLPE